MENTGRQTKYIFVTGGVVSSLGKGLAAASIGAILEGHGIDPALYAANVAPSLEAGLARARRETAAYSAPTDKDIGRDRPQALRSRGRSGTIRVRPPFPVMRKVSNPLSGQSRAKSPSASEIRNPHP